MYSSQASLPLYCTQPQLEEISDANKKTGQVCEKRMRWPTQIKHCERTKSWLTTAETISCTAWPFSSGRLISAATHDQRKLNRWVIMVDTVDTDE